MMACKHACTRGSQKLKPGILFDHFLPYVSRQGLLTNTAALPQLAQGTSYFHLQNSGATASRTPHPLAFMWVPVLTFAQQALYPRSHLSRPSLGDFLVAKKPRTFLELMFFFMYANYARFFLVHRILSVSLSDIEKKCVDMASSVCSA